MASNRALILYVSLTGNTKIIAQAFCDQAIEEGWSCDMVQIKATTDLHNPQIYFDDYDLVMLGSPIMAGLPSPWLGKRLCPTDESPSFYHDKNIGPGKQMPPKDVAPFAAVFTTYGGNEGPIEAVATLEIEAQYLRNLYCTIIGRFATTGAEKHHNAVDDLSDSLKLPVDETSAMLARYKENPEDEEFKALGANELKALKACAAMPDSGEKTPWKNIGKEAYEFIANQRGVLSFGMGPSIGGHYDRENRPNADDVIKAKLYMKELLRDHFWSTDMQTGKTHYVSGPKRKFGGEYLSIT